MTYVQSFYDALHNEKNCGFTATPTRSVLYATNEKSRARMPGFMVNS